MNAVVEIRSTVPVARARADRIRQGLQDWLETVQEIALAWERGDWEVLGYASWEAYVDEEIGARLRLTEVHRRQAVTALRLVGMSTRAIGTALGISHSTAARDVASVSAETDALPATVMSLDGRQRPATRPTPAVEPDRWSWQCFGCGKWFEGTKNTCPRCGGSGTNRRPIAEPADECDTHPNVDDQDELAGLGEQYETDPAARIAAVAEVAPEFVRRVDAVLPAGPADDDEVWIAIARRGIEAHDPPPGAEFTVCRRSTRNGLIVTARQARERHDAKWCPRCWPAAPVAAVDVPAAPALPSPPVPAVVVDVVDEPRVSAPSPTSPGDGADAPTVDRPQLTLTQIARLRAALRHAQQWCVEPREYELPFAPPPGVAPLARAELVAVQWHRDGYLSVRYLSDGGRYDVHSVELYVAGVDQALDVLCALGLLPADLSTLYAAGVRAGLRAGDALDGQLVEDGPR